MTDITHFSMGFALNPQRDRVALIQKLRPKWMFGKLNGIGGHVEPGESSLDCMCREFFEETSVPTMKEQWRFIGNLFRNGEYSCDVYSTVLSQKDWNDLKTTTDEQVVRFNLKSVFEDRYFLIHNLPALLGFAIDPTEFKFSIEYTGEDMT